MPLPSHSTRAQARDRVVSQYECVRCGRDESYQRPGRCVDVECDGRMVARRYVPEAELNRLIEECELAAEQGRLVGLQADRYQQALIDIRAEISHGATANWEYIEKRFEEALDA